MRVADEIALTLARQGVRHAFGMPGGEVVTLVDALEAAGIRFVLARHETAAAMMAAGAAVATGAPGLLVTTLGPGLANAVNGIADAAQEHAPLLVLSGAVEHELRGRYTHQILDHRALLHPLVKGSFEVAASGAGAVAARAAALARLHPAGPVHLDVSPAIAAQEVGERRIPALPQPHRPAPAADDPVLRDVAARLATARRPLILAGYEAARDGAGAALTRSLTAFGIPVLTTYKAKGVVDERLSGSLGAAGLSPTADRLLLPLVASADLILLVGYDPIEMRPGWLDPFGDCPLVCEISAHPADHGMHQAHQSLIMPVAAGLAAILDLLPSADYWPDGEPVRVRQALDAAFAVPGGWGPHQVFSVLQETLPDTAVVTVDSGAHRILLSQMWQARQPLRFLQSAGFCTMGAALPLAIGHRISRPDLPVVAVLGDGGLEMGLGELGTLRDQGLPVIVLVLQDQSLALIDLKQQQAGLAQAGVTLGDTDFVRIAEGFGGHGAAVTTADGLREALTAALTRPGFSLITARIDARSYFGKL